jgi:3-dehydroquinate dehydratase/shikimate dehydrogenase
MEIKTERLILRSWRERDLEPFAKLCADPRVMEYFPDPLSRQESDVLAGRIQTRMRQQGWGFWAAEAPGVADFIGFIGLGHVPDVLPFAPAVEIGWRLAFEYWGQGYATEGALASLKYGFETLKLGEIVAFTATQNERSRRVMEKLGMHRDPKDDFDSPKIPEGHPLRSHVLYRLNKTEWNEKIHL